MNILGFRSLVVATVAVTAAIRPPLEAQKALPHSKFAPKTVSCRDIDNFLADQLASETATEWHRMGLIWNVKVRGQPPQSDPPRRRFTSTTRLQVPEHAFRAVARTEDAKVDLRTADDNDYTDDIDWHKMGFVCSVQIPKAAFAPVHTTARPKSVDFAPPGLGEAVGNLLGKQQTSQKRREERLGQSSMKTQSAIFLGAEKKRWRGK